MRERERAYPPFGQRIQRRPRATWRSRLRGPAGSPPAVKNKLRLGSYEPFGMNAAIHKAILGYAIKSPSVWGLQTCG